MSNHEASAPAESRKISVLLKVYGIYCLVTAAAVLALLALIAIPLAQYGAELFRERHDVTLTMTLVAVQLVTMFLASVGYVAFGVLVLKRRSATSPSACSCSRTAADTWRRSPTRCSAWASST